MSDKMKPTSRIAELREKAGLTQRELSEKVGVTENTIQNWEKNTSIVKQVTRFMKLCEALNCNLEDLVIENTNTNTDYNKPIKLPQDSYSQEQDIDSIFHALNTYGFRFKSRKQRQILVKYLGIYDDAIDNLSTKDIHKEIAREVGITENTIKSYFSQIFQQIRKLQNKFDIMPIYRTLTLENLREEITNIVVKKAINNFIINDNYFDNNDEYDESFNPKQIEETKTD